ncbi:MAG: M2 family metallopeptidase [Candidatus Kapabacteria bacterium]|nr:M2 family metallopeptidase [Candidatus Kapabacteria bacterium]
MEQEFLGFVKDYEAKMKPAYKNMALSYFEASINSNEENWKKYAENEKLMNAILADKEAFNKLKKIKESNLIKDELLSRHLTVLYNTFLSKQIDIEKLNKLTEMQSNLENKYSNFRTVVGGKKLSDNDVEEILKKSTDTKELQNVWVSQKKIGSLVAKDILDIVRLRNEVAKELGFKNFHEMSLKLSEQDPQEIEKLFDELDNLTRDAFKQEKELMDKVLAERLKIKPEELMPWHYQNRFFQEAPKIYDVDLDKYYENVDIVEVAKKYYQGLNLPIDDLVAKSDLFEKENKNQHAYCINIDRDAKDIRVLCNIKPTTRWMETTLHEYGHAIYEKFLGDDLPWDLKQPAHIFTTEAIAMLFGRQATNPEWMAQMINLPTEEKNKIADACFKTLKLQQLVFSRWSQVMYRFEKSMYENPEQDLNKLWWDLVEKYQMIKRPAGRNEPDWATKIHIATSPCYYHNYHMGELFASQLYFSLADKALKTKETKNLSFVNSPEAGKFLIENVFKPGAKYFWNDMIEKATGEKLTAKYYAKQFVSN